MTTMIRSVLVFLLFVATDFFSAHAFDLAREILDPESSFELIGQHIATSVNARSQIAEELDEKSPALIDLNPRLALVFHAIYDFGRNCPAITKSLLATGVFENIHVHGKTGGGCTVHEREEIDERLSGFQFGDERMKRSPSFQRLAADIKPKSTGLFFEGSKEHAANTIEQPIVPLHYGRGIATFKDHILARASHSHMDTASGGEFVVLKGFQVRYEPENVPYEVLVWGPLTLADVDKLYFERQHWERIDSATKEMLAAAGIETLCYTFGQAQADVYKQNHLQRINIHWDHEWAQAIRDAEVVYAEDLVKRTLYNAKIKACFEDQRLDLISKAQAEPE